MSQVLFGRVTHAVLCFRPTAPGLAWPVGAAPARRRSRPPVASVASGPILPSPAAPAPKNRGRFFEGVSRQLMAIGKREEPTSATGQWAARFAAALSQYAAAQSALHAMAKPTADNAGGAQAYRAACRTTAKRLDVVLRMKERVPADLVGKLGQLSGATDDDEGTLDIGVWVTLSRALTLSRMMLSTPPPPAVVAVLTPAPPSDPLASLLYLRHLLEAIAQSRISLPDVTRWSIDMYDALANYDAAEAVLEARGRGFASVHVLNALQCCEQLLAEEARLPFSPQNFTGPDVVFESSQRWIDEAGDYRRAGKHETSKCEAVRSFLCLRLYDLKQMAGPAAPNNFPLLP